MSDRSETKQPADEGRLDRRVRRVVDARELATHSEIAAAVRGIEKERRDAMRELMRDFDHSYYYPNLKDMREACGRIGHKWQFSHHGPLGDPWFLCGVCHAHECRPERESAELAAERARGDAAVAEAAEAWRQVHLLKAETSGPDGFATWKDAATDERVRRVKAEAEAARLQAAIEQAPHDKHCVYFEISPANDCDCWKRAALGER